MIVVEGVYANSGEVAPLAAIWALKERFKYRCVGTSDNTKTHMLSEGGWRVARGRSGLVQTSMDSSQSASSTCRRSNGSEGG